MSELPSGAGWPSLPSLLSGSTPRWGHRSNTVSHPSTGL